MATLKRFVFPNIPNNTQLLPFFFSLFLLTNCDGDESSVTPQSGENQILGFAIQKSANPSLSSDVNGIIDETNNTVSLNLPSDTDIKSLVPEIHISTSAVVDPENGETTDFTNAVTYTVTAQDGTSQVYTVTATVAKKSDKEVLSFKFLADKNSVLSEDATGYIDEEKKTIEIGIPFGTDVTQLIPTLVISGGATADPINEKVTDFTSPVSYTITAEDGSTQAYTISVLLVKSSEKKVLSFSLLMSKNQDLYIEDVTGEIDEETKKIKLVVPNDVDLTALVPTISISENASINPSNESIADLSSSVEYTVTAQDGTTQIYVAEVLIDAITINGFSPTSGSPLTHITISGTRFSGYSESAAMVKFNGTSATVLEVTETSLIVEIPQGASTGKITISAAGRNMGTSANDFTITSRWKKLADFAGVNTQDRTRAFSFSTGGKGYIGGGRADEIVNDVWEYDPTTNAWTQKADFGGVKRQDATAFSIGNKGYVGTGFSSSFRQLDFWEYDPGSNQWTRKADFAGEGRTDAVSFTVGDKGYFALGFGTSVPLKDLWEYDPTLDKWTQKTDFGGDARYNASAFSIGAKAYVGTGQQSNEVYYKDFWEYDPSANQWTKKTDFGGTERRLATGFTLDGQGYIVSGSNKTVYYSETWVYDPVSDLWSQKENMPGEGRHWTKSFVIDGKAYAGIGRIESGIVQGDWYLYDSEGQFTTATVE